jgi:hypothetical protein
MTPDEAITAVPEEPTENPSYQWPATREWMQRAQIDAMMATATLKPRPEISKIRQRMLTYATIDEETAESCIYTLRRLDPETKKPKYIQGPSIRLAEILTVCWRNMWAGAHTVANDGRKVTAQGICVDLENNVSMFSEVSRRITHKDGRPYSEDMQIVTAQACAAIAKRNAIFAVVPFALIRPVYQQIKDVLTGDVSTLETKRDKIFKRFYSMGVEKQQILGVLGKESAESVDMEDLTLLIGLGTAIRDKEITIEEAFAVAPEGEAETIPVKVKLRDKLLARRAAKQPKEDPK